MSIIFWTEFRVAAEGAVRLATSVDHPVNIIADLKDNVLLSSGVFLQFRSAQTSLPANAVKIILVSTSIFIRVMLSIYCQLDMRLGKQLAIADSLEEARTLIAEQDPQPEMS